MATLGRRKMIRKVFRDPSGPFPVGLAVQGINLGLAPSRVQPLAEVGVQPVSLGGPIMREDFITSTTLMPPKFL